MPRYRRRGRVQRAPKARARRGRRRFAPQDLDDLNDDDDIFGSVGSGSELGHEAAEDSSSESETSDEGEVAESSNTGSAVQVTENLSATLQAAADKVMKQQFAVQSASVEHHRLRQELYDAHSKQTRNNAEKAQAEALQSRALEPPQPVLGQGTFAPAPLTRYLSPGQMVRALFGPLRGTVGIVLSSYNIPAAGILTAMVKFDMHPPISLSYSDLEVEVPAVPQPFSDGFYLNQRVRLDANLGLGPSLPQRDAEGVIKGRDVSKGSNLMVEFQRPKGSSPNLPFAYLNPLGLDGSSSGLTMLSVAPTQICTEAVWQGRKLQEYASKAQALAQQVSKAHSAMTRAKEAVNAAENILSELQGVEAKAMKILNKHKKSAASIELVTSVRFKSNMRPQAWRDISNWVTLEWAVAVTTTDKESSKTAMLRLADFQPLACAVKDASKEINGSHILLARGVPLQQLAKGRSKCVSIALNRKSVKEVLDKRKPRSEPPPPLHSFSLLKAALGALDGVVLQQEVQQFFDSPETGIIRAKQVELPKSLASTLRPYQVTGYQWLVNNARNGLGCILADDMGLGKTLQAISLLLYMKQQGMLEHPVLVVVPKGLLSNWQKEVKRWAGDELRVHLYYGNDRRLLANAMPKANEEGDGSAGGSSSAGVVSTGSAPSSSAPTPAPKIRRRSKQPEQNPEAASLQPARKGKRVREPETADILLTSYTTFRSDVEKLATEQVFSCMILDEAQQIKNYNSLVSKAVKRMAEEVGNVRVALSGTPVENRMADLHSLFEFILPGYLASSRAEFERDFGKPLLAAVKAGRASSEEVATKQRLLQRLVQPFVLRRLKTDPAIAADLPSKVEQTHECELSAQQQALYKLVQETCLQNAAAAGPGPGAAFARHGQVLSMLHALREVCNHPACLSEKRRPPDFRIPPSASLDASGKTSKLQELLEGIIGNNDKVLIFTGYLGTIDLLAEQIEANFNCKTLRIVGAMDKVAREAAVEAFQTDPSCQVMLLSLQAGGVGLTLTAATHVIHFDRCYNPAKENQATDRAHRIGQTKTVFVHRLQTKDTFEERLAEIMSQKQQLSDLTMEAGEGWIADLDDAELRALFSLGGSGSAGASKRRRNQAA
eukprot:TRINITY_DN27897_c0_g1_i1.p1 TRINITY_DN27897_c0_g1~~TRINITY_DN27897_c0_g1_i1.p1  ORF type:complete len:1117 (+),score=255.90 TRINITY_DN27897_c0_g1_i1:39-3389(+)